MGPKRGVGHVREEWVWGLGPLHKGLRALVTDGWPPYRVAAAIRSVMRLNHSTDENRLTFWKMVAMLGLSRRDSVIHSAVWEEVNIDIFLT